MTLKSLDSVKVLTVRSTSFEAAPDGGSGTVEDAVSSSSYEKGTGSEWISQELSKNDRPDLASAKIVVSGGIHFLYIININKTIILLLLFIQDEVLSLLKISK